MVFADYHLVNRLSGDISVLDDRQRAMSESHVGSSVTIKQIGGTLITEASTSAATGQVLAVTSTDLADRPSPSATMADSRALVTKATAVWHFSLSTLVREPLGT
jgi:hypothetical protein